MMGGYGKAQQFQAIIEIFLKTQKLRFIQNGEMMEDILEQNIRISLVGLDQAM